MSKHILQWNQFQKQRLISNSKRYATSLNEIFEELIDSGIPADTMIRPTSVLTSFPTSPTAAFTSLPSPHINRAFTPNSGHSRQHSQAFTPNSGQYRHYSKAFTPNSGHSKQHSQTFNPNSGHSRQHSQRKFQPKKKTFNTTFAGCPGCQADPESQLNNIDQVMHHDESTCPWLNSANIRDKSTREASNQYKAKNPPTHDKSKRASDYK